MYALKTRVQFNYKHMQCPTMCYKTKQTASLICVWGGQLLVCEKCGGGREGGGGRREEGKEGGEE